MEYDEQERLEKEANDLMEEIRNLQFEYAKDKNNENLKQQIKEKRDKLFNIKVALTNSISSSSKTR